MINNTIKILHIDTEKGWRGGQQQAIYLFEGLLKRNYETAFICRPKSKLLTYLRKNNFPFFEVSMKNEFDLFSAFKIAKYARKNNFNILHLHSAHAHSIGLLAKLFNRSLKTVSARRVDFKIKDNIFSKFKYNSSLIDKIVCISDEIKRVMIECGINKNKLKVIHSGVNIHKFDNIKKSNEIRKKYNIPENNIIIGTVAALVGHKDYPNLLQAASIVIKNRKDVTFLAVGNGKNEFEIKKLHEELKLGKKFVFTGYQNEVGKYLKSFDIFVLASKKEGLGTSVLDAQSAGIPVIATKAGGIPEMIENNINGILVNPQSPKQLADALIDLIDNDKKRKEIANNGKKYVNKFSIENTIKKNIKLYKELLEIDDEL